MRITATQHAHALTSTGVGKEKGIWGGVRTDWVASEKHVPPVPSCVEDHR